MNLLVILSGLSAEQEETGALIFDLGGNVLAIVLETSRLLLRHFTMDDLDSLYRIYAKPGVYRYIGNGKLPTYEQERERLRKQIEKHYRIYGYGLWATIYKANNQLIGRCGLITQEVDGNREVEIGYLLDPDYWGQGLATEAARSIRDYAFQRMKVNRLISLIQPQNYASIRVAEKNGMKLWKTVEFKGVPDVCVYRILRSEWEKRNT